MSCLILASFFLCFKLICLFVCFNIVKERKKKILSVEVLVFLENC